LLPEVYHPHLLNDIRVYCILLTSFRAKSLFVWFAAPPGSVGEVVAAAEVFEPPQSVLAAVAVAAARARAHYPDLFR